MTWPTERYALDDRFLRAKIAQIVADNHIQVVVETGIAAGRSAVEFCKIAPRYIGIDNDPECIYQGSDRLEAAGLTNWTLHLGDSTSWLPKIMRDLPADRTLFFLDAHAPGAYWPCFDEIAAVPCGQGILAFHDFRVPGKDFGVDDYTIDGVIHDFNYELIRGALTAWSPTHRMEYMQESDPASSYRGVGFAYPS